MPPLPPVGLGGVGCRADLFTHTQSNHIQALYETERRDPELTGRPPCPTCGQQEQAPNSKNATVEGTNLARRGNERLSHADPEGLHGDAQRQHNRYPDGGCEPSIAVPRMLSTGRPRCSVSVTAGSTSLASLR
eukprot:62124-Chlamydomonas_euryale.AAC.2